ncbi:hypothetical protein PRBRB14_18300 [Hallella multisaccharivorax DSM 17128]|nr:hypothetical protein PRBRB14_18300 [Hallella multisaccharivorax DSM 17128]
MNSSLINNLKTMKEKLIADLSVQEMMETDGGMPWYVGFMLGGLFWDLIGHTGSTIDSFKKGADKANREWDNK